MDERELKKREKELEAREKELDRREKQLDGFSQAIKERKESWYDRLPVSEKGLTWLIRIVSVLLGAVVLLIILEAAGVYKLNIFPGK